MGFIVVSGLIVGLIGVPIGGTFFGQIVGLFLGLIVFSGLIVGLIGAVLKIQPVERAGFRWADVSSRRSAALRYGLSSGLVVGLIVGGLSAGLVGGLLFGLVVGLLFGLVVGVVVGLIRLFTSEATPETRSAVNEGTHRSIKMALMFGLSIGLIVGLIFGGLGGGNVGLSGGLVFGQVFGLISGGMFALKHLVLRLFLWRNRSAPLHYVAFLAQARELLFLRQVGGGYIFIHRLLREYFVSLSESKEDSEEKINTAPAA